MTCKIKIVFVLLGMMALTPYSWGQTGLGKYGNTPLQKQTGTAVQKTCGGFVKNVGGLNPPGSSPTNKTPLWQTCFVMVQTGAQLDNQGAANPNSLNINQNQLAGAFQQIATEEFAATESMATEISTNRSDAVINRLSAVRAGVSGFSVSGFQPESNSALLADGSWLQPESNLRGGSAGDDEPGSALSGFANINYGFGNRDGTENTDEFDYNSYNVTLGLDYRFGSNLVVGGALTYFNIDSEFKTQSALVANPVPPGGTGIASTVGGGDTEVSGFGGVVYATWYGEHFYLDGLAGYAVSSYDLTRNIIIPSNNPLIEAINETAKASPDGQDVSLGFGAGYTWNPGAISWGPYFRLNYLNADIDGYQESGADASGLNLKVDGQDWTSLTSVLGASFSWAISSGSGVIVPQARLGWVHQFENDSSIIDAVYVADPRNNVLRATTADPEEDYAELGLAISSVFKGGAQAYFAYDTLLGFEDLTSHLFTLGGRWEF